MSRALSNVLVEALARAAFPELADARPWTVSRRMGDVRDELDGIVCATVSGQKRARLAAEARAAGIEIEAAEGNVARPAANRHGIPSAHNADPEERKP